MRVRACVHVTRGWLSSSHAGPRYQRPAPPKYVDKFMALPLSADTAHLYAMLEHVDDQVTVGERAAQLVRALLPHTAA